MKRKKDNLTGHLLRRNCVLKRLIEGNVKGSREITERRGRRRKQLLDHLKEKTGYWKLQEEEPDYPICRTRFGKVHRPIVRQARKQAHELIN